MGGRDPYSSSKACAELVTQSFRDSFFSNSIKASIGIASARAGNVIGGGDGAVDRLIPDAMRAFASGRQLEIRNPAHIRPWQHVLDPLAGYFTLCQELSSDPKGFSGAWNFGPNPSSMVSVEVIIDKVMRAFGEDAGVRSVGTHDDLYEAPILRLDTTKACERLSWKSRWDLDQSVAKTIDWYKLHMSSCNMAEETSRQIKTFEMSNH